MKRALGGWQVKGQKAAGSLPELQLLKKTVSKHHRIPGKSQSDLVIGTNGPRRRDPEHLSAALGNNILGQFGMMGRIGEVVREKSGLAYYAYSSLSGGIGPGSWEVSAGVNPQNVSKARQLFQAAVMSSLVATQRNNLYAGPSNIVQVRTQIATLLRSLLTGTASADAVKADVLRLSAIYGELDGENNHAYATVFAQVYKTLTADQKTRLAALRKSIMSGTYPDGTRFDFSVSTTYYLYSGAITDVNLLAPYIGNTDYLFFEP